MTDTTRADFEAWFSNTFGPSSLKKTSGNKYLWAGVDATCLAYEAATLKATLKERERCAMACEQEKERSIASAKWAGVLIDQRDYDICIARIRSGQ